MRLVADMVRPLSPVVALVQLGHMPQLAAKPLASVLASAIANAKQKNSPVEALSIKIIEVMGGPSMKRWHAVSRGQAHSYKKRMTHVRIVLSDEAKESVKKEEKGKK